MVKHVVVWKLKDFAEGKNKTENAQTMKSLLAGMQGKIPGLKHLEVGINITKEQSDVDVVLFSEFAAQADLDIYQDHPVHVAVKDFIGKVCTARYVIDYEV
jgi:hypothetical protein